MSDDWKPGDLALCVREPVGTLAATGLPSPVKRGRIYTVDAVLLADDGLIGLRLVAIVFPNCRDNAARASNFRKINPLTDQERERFVAELNTPVRENV